MYQPVISGTGVFTPSQTITNDELVVAFNAYADKFNTENAAAIAAGAATAERPYTYKQEQQQWQYMPEVTTVVGR